MIANYTYVDLADCEINGIFENFLNNLTCSAPITPTHGYQGNCSSEVIEVSVMLYSKISSNMADHSARKTMIGSCYVFRIKFK